MLSYANQLLGFWSFINQCPSKFYQFFEGFTQYFKAILTSNLLGQVKVCKANQKIEEMNFGTSKRLVYLSGYDSDKHLLLLLTGVRNSIVTQVRGKDRA